MRPALMRSLHSLPVSHMSGQRCPYCGGICCGATLAAHCDLRVRSGVLPAGFALAPDGIQVVTKPDKEGNQIGTGVAYVRFSNPEEAERARKERHRAQMGARYIECLPFTASHYTSPPQVPAPLPPFALGHYPAGMAAAAAAARPYPPIGSLGRGLPPQPQQQSYDDARLYAQQRAGPGMAAPRGVGAAGRARGGAPGRGGRPMAWAPSQPPGRPGMPPGQAPPPPYGVQTPSPRAGRGYQPQVCPTHRWPVKIEASSACWPQLGHSCSCFLGGA